MDGLWTGAACEQIYVNDGYKDDHFGNNQPFYDPLKSNIEALLYQHDGVKFGYRHLALVGAPFAKEHLPRMAESRKGRAICDVAPCADV